jgi:NAD(P)-dependent dehydrogenase (short-subunit alcohol dehydrogenase family)
MGRKETIEETAERVTKAGGKGIALRVDHGSAPEVERLVSRIKKEAGGLDILVNDIWGGDAQVEWGRKFWELDMDAGWSMVQNALRTHLVTARFAAPLLISRKGLLVEITDGDHFGYRGHLLYDLVKTSIIRLAYTQNVELAKEGAMAVAVTPGFLRSEAMLDLFGVREDNWRDAVKKAPDFVASETPLFVGRAIAALAADPERKQYAGRVLASWTLSEKYRFPDATGERPHWGRYFDKTFGKNAQPALDEPFYAYWRPLKQLDDILGQGTPKESR